MTAFVLNAFRRLGCIHTYSQVVAAKIRACSTPFGVWDVFTLATTLSCALSSAVLNAFRRLGCIHTYFF